MAVTGRVQKTARTPRSTRPAEDLTCDENQVEDLLSEGESTDAEHDGIPLCWLCLFERAHQIPGMAYPLHG